MSDQKLSEAADQLQEAIACLQKSSLSEIEKAGIVKSFEVALEYAWKEMKRRAVDAGLEAYSPKESIRAAAGLGLIEEPEAWIQFVNVRNLTVHDYIGVNDETFSSAVREFGKELQKFLTKLS